MKWLKERVGVGDISQQIVRVFSGSDARGIIISAFGYTDPAITRANNIKFSFVSTISAS